MKFTSRLSALIAIVGFALAVQRAGAALTPYWVSVPISAAAIASDPTLVTQQTWSLRVTLDEGMWHVGSMRVSLPAGNVFYQHPLGNETRPSDAVVAVFPSLGHDTYVTSPREQTSGVAPHLVGAHPNGVGPPSLGGPLDPTPGVFSVSWVMFNPSLGPGPGDYEIARLTFPASATATVLTSGQFPSYTESFAPVQVVPIPPIPEPHAGAIVACAALMLRRGR